MSDSLNHNYLENSNVSFCISLGKKMQSKYFTTYFNEAFIFLLNLMIFIINHLILQE